MVWQEKASCIVMLTKTFDFIRVSIEPVYLRMILLAFKALSTPSVSLLVDTSGLPLQE
jgi:hypothetical protein